MPKTYEYDRILVKQFQERADMQADLDITISKYKIFLSQARYARHSFEVCFALPAAS
jgi:hypothetical protein